MSVGGKTLFPPSPFQSRHSYRLIDKLIFQSICVFVSFLPTGTPLCIRLFMFPVQMPSLVYLIFAKNRTGWEKNFLPDGIRASHLAPVSRALVKPVPEMA